MVRGFPPPRRRPAAPARRGGGRARAVLFAIIIGVIVSISTIVGFYTDFLWFQEVGFTSVFWTVLVSRVLPAVVLGSAFFLFALANLLVVSRLRPLYAGGSDAADPMDRVRLLFLPFIRKLAVAGSALLGALFGLGVLPEWERFTLFRNATTFGTTDPLFQNDIGFYVFKLPVYQYLYGWMFTTLVIVTIAVAVLHYLTGGIRLMAGSNRFAPAVKAHLSVLLALMAILKAWGYRLDQYDLLYSRFLKLNVTGASYTDVNARLIALRLLLIISLVAAVVLLVNVRFRGWTLPVVSVGVWALVAVLAGGVFPFVVQRFQVVPSELTKERKFINYNIEATRAAYGLSDIESEEYPAETGITAEEINANPATIENIRLFDPRILERAYRQLQEIRTYYEFVDVDVDRYTLDGKQQQVMLSTRELAVRNIESQSWVNNHLLYTHGYGAVVSPTNATTGTGQPAFLVQDIPPTSTAQELQIEQGGVYFGESLAEYSIVNSDQRELDYVGQETGTRYTKYAGKGGVELSGPLRRLAFAWRFRDMNLAISGLVNSDSKILYNRQIAERLHKVAPFLQFDGDPYAVIVNGRIVWMADAYTTTRMYPYSERIPFEARTGTRGGVGPPSVVGENSYIRNSVKATVDAYDGTVTLYVWDTKDPIIRSWQKAFPDIFKTAADMPPELKAHVRYPEDLFRIQTYIYRKYHVTDPTVFYSGEDQWVIPRDPNEGEGAEGGTQAEEIQPYYVLMKMPGAEQEEYVLILPMNPLRRPNMVAWVSAKSGPEDYGQLSDFRFPKSRQIFGVGQIQARINSTDFIAREISLLDQQGSRVQFGNLLVIPIGNSVLYVQPLFLQAERNAIPELKFVILATSEQVVLGTSLDDAINQLLQGAGAPIATPTGPTQAESTTELIRQALEHLNNAEEAARRGDWATYGREQQAAKDKLQRANEQQGGAPNRPPPT